MRILAATWVMAAVGCGGSTSISAGEPMEAGTNGSVDSAAADAVDDSAPPCTDPLRTREPQRDLYDCEILKATAEASEPDPMIFKAEIELESAYDRFATSADAPCGIRSGWSDAECKSFGLMQLTPACGYLMEASLPDGHPNLTRDELGPEWATSVYNPSLNIRAGVRALEANRQDVAQSFPACTENEYTLMALGAYNQGKRAILGCGMMTPQAQSYVGSVLLRYKLIATLAGWPIRY
jgi:hypothetical protein